MDRIKFKNINFNRLEELTEVNSSEGKLYVDSDYKNLYKIYDLSIACKSKTVNLLKLEKSSPIEHVIWPHSIIYKKYVNKAAGCIMPYIEGAINLKDFFKYNDDTNIFNEIVKDASSTLRNIHKSGIIVGDVSFYNILFDLEYNHYFCDIDSIKTNADNYSISGLCEWYFRNRNLERLNVDENFDRFSMLLNYLYMIFNRTPESISDRLYEEKEEQFPFLNNIKEIVIFLRKRKINIPEIPYLDDFIQLDQKKLVKIKKN